MALKDLTPLETTLLTKFLKRHLKDLNDGAMGLRHMYMKDTPENRAFVEAIERGTDAGPIEYEGLCIQGDSIFTEDFIILEHLLHTHRMIPTFLGFQMPNWCSNDLTITGPEKTVQTIASLIGLKEEKPEFDFNKVIAYPSKFRDQDAVAEMARKNKDYTVKDGFNSGGYDWCVNHWGTKWNVGSDIFNLSLEAKKVKVSFDTAWGPPEPVVKALAAQFPDCKLKLAYYEAGMGFKGKLIVKGSEVLEDMNGKYRGNRGG